MLANILFFGLFAGAFAQETINEGYSDFDVLQDLAEEGRKTVLESLANVNNAPSEYDYYLEERLNCLLWECTVQEQNINKTMTEAVFKGMLKNKQFTNFQCISSNSQDTLNKIDQIRAQIPVSSQKIKQKGLGEIMPHKVTLPAFLNYVQDLYQKKNEEMKKAEDEVSRKKILEEVKKKIKLLGTIMDQINSFVKNTKFKFIEEYISYAFTTETALRNAQKEGSQKIMKCVA